MMKKYAKVVILSVIILCFLFLYMTNSSTYANKSALGSILPTTLISPEVRRKYPATWEDPLIIKAEERLADMVVHPAHEGPVSTNVSNRAMSKYDRKKTIYFIPEVPKSSLHDDVWKIASNITFKYKVLSPRQYTEKILILTPIHNSENSLNNYARQILGLSYPKSLISLALGEDSSHDNTLSMAHKIVKNFTWAGLRNVRVIHFNITGQVEGNWNEIHHVTNQLKRRRHLAKARNSLWKTALKDEDYVLWIDSDVGTLPKDLIQQLLWPQKDVVVPSCLYRMGQRIRVYDKNTWRETETSLKAQKAMSSDDMVVEGYGPTDRIYLPDLRAEGRAVPLDGVGGCTLLVKADCHRKGLEFPEKVFQHHIETEGLGKLAKHMGYQVYGVPFVEVFHS